jgi:hypothetical protein
MKKEELKNGDIVTLRNGNRLIYANEQFLDMSDKNNNDLSYIDDLNEDLTFYDKDDYEYDVIKVERMMGYFTIYAREKMVKEMTVAEISKALGYEVKIVKEK